MYKSTIKGQMKHTKSTLIMDDDATQVCLSGRIM